MPAPGYVSKITVASVAATAVIVQSATTRRVVVGEDPSVSGWPTTDFLVMRPTLNNAARRVPAGEVYTFEGLSPFPIGAVVGYISTVAGSTTFFQDEM